MNPLAGNLMNETQALSVLNQLSETLVNLPPSEFIQALPDKLCDILSVPICILWEIDQKHERLKVIAASRGVDELYKKIELDLNDQSVKSQFLQEQLLYIENINSQHLKFFGYREALERKWVSLLSIALKAEKEIGFLYIITTKVRAFPDIEKKMLKIISNYIITDWQRKEKEEILNDKNKFQQLTQIMLEMTSASESEQLWQLLQKAAKKLGGTERIWIGRLDHLTGEITNINDQRKGKDKKYKISFGTGIIGKVIKDEKAILVNDVTTDEWKHIYIKHWQDTRSELAIPILIDQLTIREGTDVKLGSKIIGVLNVESKKVNAFSEIDRDRLDLLARYAAILLDKLEYEQKLKALRPNEKEISQIQNFDKILETLGDAINRVLQFEWVNISKINPERTSIKPEYVRGIGLSKLLAKEFKVREVRLDSKDIQADIVKKRIIEVLDQDDERFDKEIYQKYGHDRLIRVYIPMIEASSNQVIGTVEAGYKREYRKHIYEQDIQILKSLIEQAMDAFARKKAGLIDRISHECKAPIVAIKNNADFLQRHMNSLANNKITIKLNDIMIDCDLLLYQVQQIEFFLGKKESQEPKLERTVVFRDVIIKTIYPLINGLRLPLSSIEYNSEDSNRIIIDTDKAMLNQVVYNLLLNAIKYAEKASVEPLKVVLEVEEEKENFIIKFKDWGIGIKQEYNKKIFDQGFRTPEAKSKNVTGSGLGLSISQEIMKRLGGDLILVGNYKPTEFHLILSKNNKESTR